MSVPEIKVTDSPDNELMDYEEDATSNQSQRSSDTQRRSSSSSPLRPQFRQSIPDIHIETVDYQRVPEYETQAQYSDNVFDDSQNEEFFSIDAEGKSRRKSNEETSSDVQGRYLTEVLNTKSRRSFSDSSPERYGRRKSIAELTPEMKARISVFEEITDFQGDMAVPSHLTEVEVRRVSVDYGQDQDIEMSSDDVFSPSTKGSSRRLSTQGDGLERRKSIKDKILNIERRKSLRDESIDMPDEYLEVDPASGGKRSRPSEEEILVTERRRSTGGELVDIKRRKSIKEDNLENLQRRKSKDTSAERKLSRDEIQALNQRRSSTKGELQDKDRRMSKEEIMTSKRRRSTRAELQELEGERLSKGEIQELKRRKSSHGSSHDADGSSRRESVNSEDPNIQAALKAQLGTLLLLPEAGNDNYETFRETTEETITPEVMARSFSELEASEGVDDAELEEQYLRAISPYLKYRKSISELEPYMQFQDEATKIQAQLSASKESQDGDEGSSSRQNAEEMHKSSIISENNDLTSGSENESDLDVKWEVNETDNYEPVSDTVSDLGRRESTGVSRGDPEPKLVTYQTVNTDAGNGKQLSRSNSLRRRSSIPVVDVEPELQALRSQRYLKIASQQTEELSMDKVDGSGISSSDAIAQSPSKNSLPDVEEQRSQTSNTEVRRSFSAPSENQAVDTPTSDLETNYKDNEIINTSPNNQSNLDIEWNFDKPVRVRKLSNIPPDDNEYLTHRSSGPKYLNVQIEEALGGSEITERRKSISDVFPEIDFRRPSSIGATLNTINGESEADLVQDEEVSTTNNSSPSVADVQSTVFSLPDLNAFMTAPRPELSSENQARKSSVSNLLHDGQSRKSSISDHSPQTKSRKNSVSDHSPQTKSRKSSVSDHSPQTKSRKSSVSDHSPQTKSRKSSQSNLSPETQSRKSSVSDQSPENQSRRGSVSPNAQSRRNSSLSPQRRKSTAGGDFLFTQPRKSIAELTPAMLAKIAKFEPVADNDSPITDETQDSDFQRGQSLPMNMPDIQIQTPSSESDNEDEDRQDPSLSHGMAIHDESSEMEYHSIPRERARQLSIDEELLILERRLSQTGDFPVVGENTDFKRRRSAASETSDIKRRKSSMGEEDDTSTGEILHLEQRRLTRHEIPEISDMERQGSDRRGSTFSNSSSSEHQDSAVSNILTSVRRGSAMSNTTSERRGSAISNISASERRGSTKGNITSERRGSAMSNISASERRGSAVSSTSASERQGSSKSNITSERRGSAMSNISVSERRGSAMSNIPASERRGSAMSNISASERRGSAMSNIPASERRGSAMSNISASERRGSAMSNIPASERRGSAMSNISASERRGSAMSNISTSERRGSGVSNISASERRGSTKSNITSVRRGSAMSNISVSERRGSAMSNIPASKRRGSAMSNISASERRGSAASNISEMERRDSATSDVSNKQRRSSARSDVSNKQRRDSAKSDISNKQRRSSAKSDISDKKRRSSARSDVSHMKRRSSARSDISDAQRRGSAVSNSSARSQEIDVEGEYYDNEQYEEEYTGEEEEYYEAEDVGDQDEEYFEEEEVEGEEECAEDEEVEGEEEYVEDEEVEGEEEYVEDEEVEYYEEEGEAEEAEEYYEEEEEGEEYYEEGEVEEDEEYYKEEGEVGDEEYYEEEGEAEEIDEYYEEGEVEEGEHHEEGEAGEPEEYDEEEGEVEVDAHHEQDDDQPDEDQGHGQAGQVSDSDENVKYLKEEVDDNDLEYTRPRTPDRRYLESLSDTQEVDDIPQDQSENLTKEQDEQYLRAASPYLKYRKSISDLEPYLDFKKEVSDLKPEIQAQFLSSHENGHDEEQSQAHRKSTESAESSIRRSSQTSLSERVSRNSRGATPDIEINPQELPTFEIHDPSTDSETEGAATLNIPKSQEEPRKSIGSDVLQFLLRRFSSQPIPDHQNLPNEDRENSELQTEQYEEKRKSIQYNSSDSETDLKVKWGVNLGTENSKVQEIVGEAATRRKSSAVNPELLASELIDELENQRKKSLSENKLGDIEAYHSLPEDEQDMGNQVLETEWKPQPLPRKSFSHEAQLHEKNIKDAHDVESDSQDIDIEVYRRVSSTSTDTKEKLATSPVSSPGEFNTHYSPRGSSAGRDSSAGLETALSPRHSVASIVSESKSESRKYSHDLSSNTDSLDIQDMPNLRRRSIVRLEPELNYPTSDDEDTNSTGSTEGLQRKKFSVNSNDLQLIDQAGLEAMVRRLSSQPIPTHRDSINQMEDELQSVANVADPEDDISSRNNSLALEKIIDEQLKSPRGSTAHETTAKTDLETIIMETLKSPRGSIIGSQKGSPALSPRASSAGLQYKLSPRNSSDLIDQETLVKDNQPEIEEAGGLGTEDEQKAGGQPHQSIGVEILNFLARRLSSQPTPELASENRDENTESVEESTEVLTDIPSVTEPSVSLGVLESPRGSVAGLDVEMIPSGRSPRGSSVTIDSRRSSRASSAGTERVKSPRGSSAGFESEKSPRGSSAGLVAGNYSTESVEGSVEDLTDIPSVKEPSVSLGVMESPRGSVAELDVEMIPSVRSPRGSSAGLDSRRSSKASSIGPERVRSPRGSSAGLEAERSTRGSSAGLEAERSPRGSSAGLEAMRSPRGSSAGLEAERSPRGSSAGLEAMRSPRGSSAGLEAERSPRGSSAGLVAERSPRGSSAGIDSRRSSRASAGPERIKSPRESSVGLEAERSPRGSSAGIDTRRSSRTSSTGLEKGRSPRGSNAGLEINRSPERSLEASSARPEAGIMESLRGSVIELDMQLISEKSSRDSRSSSTFSSGLEKGRSPRGSSAGLEEESIDTKSVEVRDLNEIPQMEELSVSLGVLESPRGSTAGLDTQVTLYERSPRNSSAGIDSRRSSRASVGAERGRSPRGSSVGLESERSPRGSSVGLEEERSPRGSTVGLEAKRSPRGSFAGLEAERSHRSSSAGLEAERSPRGSSAGLEGERLPRGSSAGLEAERSPRGSSVGLEAERSPRGSSAGRDSRRSSRASSPGLERGKTPRGSSAGLETGRSATESYVELEAESEDYVVVRDLNHIPQVEELSVHLGVLESPRGSVAGLDIEMMPSERPTSGMDSRRSSSEAGRSQRGSSAGLESRSQRDSSAGLVTPRGSTVGLDTENSTRNSLEGLEVERLPKRSSTELEMEESRGASAGLEAESQPRQSIGAEIFNFLTRRLSRQPTPEIVAGDNSFKSIEGSMEDLTDIPLVKEPPVNLGILESPRGSVAGLDVEMIPSVRSPRGSSAGLDSRKSSKASSTGPERVRSPRGSSAGLEAERSPRGSSAGLEAERSPRGSSAGLEAKRSPRGSYAGLETERSPRGSSAGLEAGRKVTKRILCWTGR
ncbi:uncharacterized protein LOC125036819 [Penaeus chinensis]|uniref:uncharacterized protein LOC125036819 n=1 Tax=Penaeus chinensis TaxID=139456 RepID=UPI001FB7F15A|nr:uncharacterized protein LOC125036819 [Penaeus chinensis]